MADIAPACLTSTPIEISSLAIIEAKAVGERIRSLRLKRSMGLVEFSHKTGLSASFLSQLETGRVVPTLRNLARISLVFNRDLAYFFRKEELPFFRVSRRRDRVRLATAGKDASLLISEDMSSIIPDQSITPTLTHFLPGKADAVLAPERLKGIEFVFVVEGSLIVSIDSGKHLLETGDALWIDASAQREYRCNENQPSTALIIPVSEQLAEQIRFATNRRPGKGNPLFMPAIARMACTSVPESSHIKRTMYPHNPKEDSDIVLEIVAS